MKTIFERKDILAKRKSELSKREGLFCIYYAECFDAALAAKKAGYKSNCEQKGLVLLTKENIAKKITQVLKTRENVLSQIALLGYEKLSFGSIADAVSLMYMDKPEKEELRNLNLLNISEIKKLKDGAMEIKFFDRLKALSSIKTATNNAQNGVTNLVDAICMGAESLSQCEDDDFGV